jgi:hypothetical protein
MFIDPDLRAMIAPRFELVGTEITPGIPGYFGRQSRCPFFRVAGTDPARMRPGEVHCREVRDRVDRDLMPGYHSMRPT